MKIGFLKVCVVLLPIVGAGCDSSHPGKETDASRGPQPGPVAAPRPETRNLEGAAAVGVNAKQLRSKVDNILDRNDERNRQLKETEKEIENQ